MILYRTHRGLSLAPVSVASQPRRQRLSDDQITARRNEDWRVAHDEGIPNEVGVIERRSLGLIAALYGVSKPTVLEGIRRARTIQAMIREAANADGE